MGSDELKIRNFQINSVDEVIVKIVGEVLRAFRIEQADEDEHADFDRFAIFNKVRGEVVTTQLIVKQSGEEKFFQTSDSILPEERRGAEIHRLVKKNRRSLRNYARRKTDENYSPVDAFRVRRDESRNYRPRQNFTATSHRLPDELRQGATFDGGRDKANSDFKFRRRKNYRRLRRYSVLRFALPVLFFPVERFAGRRKNFRVHENFFPRH